MSASDELSEILARLEGEAVRVSFVDGDIYDVEIKSASAAKEKGSFDTEIIWAITHSKPKPFDTGAQVKLKVDEVAKVEVLKSAQCVFQRIVPGSPSTPDAPPATA
ncbi:MAG TPA: hypothetical protein VJW76_09645 [Verrucomicrobiae bacterium]|nr:hypothetical protein [Verrucomicrobiae bacterium]